MYSFLFFLFVILPSQAAGTPQESSDKQVHAAPSLMADTLENTALRIALDARLSEVNFQSTDFDQALHELSAKCRINITVDWAALRENRIFADTPISLEARDTRLSRVVSAVLRIADGGRDLLETTIEDGILLVTTRQRLDSVLQTRVYSVEHLLNPKLDEREQYELQRAVTALWMRHFHVFAPPWEWMPSHVHKPAANNRSGPLVGPEQETNKILDELQKRLQSRAESELVSAIREIAPHSWAEHGGAGSIQRFENRLIIRQSARIHAEIEKLLASLEDQGKPSKPSS